MFLAPPSQNSKQGEDEDQFDSRQTFDRASFSFSSGERGVTRYTQPFHDTDLEL